MRRLPLFVCACLIFPQLLLGQLKQDANVNVSRALTSPNRIDSIFGLLGLNPDKFSMSHSYSLSFAAAGGKTFNQGLYLNSMKYRLSDPLTLHLQIGVQHQPFGNQVGNALAKNQAFISRAGMEYKPSENIKLQLEFSRQPASYRYMNSPFLNPISRNSEWFNKQQDSEKQ